MDNLIIECVWYRSKRDFNKFVRSIEDPQLSVIDFSIIKNKLIKSDPYNEEPNEYVIGLNIISAIKHSLGPKKGLVTTIVYSFKNLDEDTVINLKDLISQSTDRPVDFKLNVLNMDSVPVKNILSKFDSVRIIEND